MQFISLRLLQRCVAASFTGFMLCIPLLATAMPAPGFDIWRVSLEGEFEPENLTDRPGYDNQPAFESETGLLFTRQAGQQTDLVRMNIESGDVAVILETPESEYSPTLTPRGTISTVRVALDGVQQLWELVPGDSRYSPLLAGVEGVGYHLWLEKNKVALFIVNDPPELHIADLAADLASANVLIAARNIGRSMQRIPGAPNAFAFIEPDNDGQPWIKEFDLQTRKLTRIAPVLEGSQDFVFHPDGRLLMASGKTVYAWKEEKWVSLERFDSLPGAISRMAFSPSGRQLALVVAETSL